MQAIRKSDSDNYSLHPKFLDFIYFFFIQGVARALESAYMYTYLYALYDKKKINNFVEF
jgi:hypothetical protein